MTPGRARRSFTTAARLALTGAVALLLAAGVVVAVDGGGGAGPAAQEDQVQAAAGTSRLYVQREGYDPAAYGNGIGDPQALLMRPGAAEPVRYQETAVVQACNVLPMAEVRELGFRTRAHQLDGSFERNYFDGRGAGVLRPRTVGLPSTHDSNTCDYQLEDGGFIGLDVYQPPYATVEALVAEVNRSYAKKDPIGELNVYESVGGGDRTSIIGRGDSAVQVQLSDTIDAAGAQRVLERVAANFVRESANPTGPPEVVFDSPLLTAPYTDACDVLTVEMVEQLFGEPASPLVNQRTATSVGVLAFAATRPDGSELSDNYVRTHCRRQIVTSDTDITSFTTRRAEVSAQTFTAIEPAKTAMGLAMASTRDAQPVPGVGDEAFLGKDAAGSDRIHVRSGRVLLEAGFEPRRAQSTPEQAAQALIGLGRAAAELVPRD